MKLGNCVGTLTRWYPVALSLFQICSSKPKYFCGWQKHRASITQTHSIGEDLFSMLSWQNISLSADKGQKSVSLQKGLPLKTFSSLSDFSFFLTSAIWAAGKSHYFLIKFTVWKNVSCQKSHCNSRCFLSHTWLIHKSKSCTCRYLGVHARGSRYHKSRDLR